MIWCTIAQSLTVQVVAFSSISDNHFCHDVLFRTSILIQHDPLCTNREQKKKNRQSTLRKRAKQREFYLLHLQSEGRYDATKTPLPKPDPERWIPKSQRSYNRRDRGRGKNKSNVGAQGGGAGAGMEREAAKLDVAARAAKAGAGGDGDGGGTEHGEHQGVVERRGQEGKGGEEALRLFCRQDDCAWSRRSNFAMPFYWVASAASRNMGAAWEPWYSIWPYWRPLVPCPSSNCRPCSVQWWCRQQKSSRGEGPKGLIFKFETRSRAEI